MTLPRTKRDRKRLLAANRGLIMRVAERLHMDKSSVSRAYYATRRLLAWERRVQAAIIEQLGGTIS